ncbi:PREDICTED: mitotic checkpoint serine/threonine-protein kinase BUB1 beta isoform X1 [Crocodylus porosus]|uniref:mitotic checkpoint serine/threonine-protein kinase BUB1 beta isoform X1 n=1 Tax=Crocodylus porosus TaxID=8502 RepID=UPI0009397CB7|nr:PREDICTED: mitotic checkpoint serine/threonine-protein kinase BUB1 beta isoform X1 [Crocodylus porosus]
MAMWHDGNEWELSKENVQPLRQGRVMSTLQEALAQQDASSHTAIQQQKQEFESEIRFYSGDDPLDVWDRYIKWTEQTFPQGGKESNLSAVLERAVKALHEQHRYYQDLRYLSLWLKFGNCCSEPLDLYSYLHSQEIGTSLALFYVTWAEELEARGNYKKADLIFQEGIQRKADPLDKLQSHHRQFQARVSRHIIQGLEEESNDEEEFSLPGLAEPQRSSLADLKGKGKKTMKAPISRVGDALKVSNRGHSILNQSSQQMSNGPNFAVFDENTASASGTEFPVLTPQPWAALPAARAKENELRAGPWNSGRRPRSNMNCGAEVPCVLPAFTPYVEESAQQQVITPCKIEPSINFVLSVRKPGKEEDPLQRVQNHQQDTEDKKEVVMYCKEKVYAGVEEFSLEEIRAEIYRKKAKKRREEEFWAIAQKKEEMQKKIKELERMLRDTRDNQQQRTHEQLTEEKEPMRMEPGLMGASAPLKEQEVSFSSETMPVKELPHVESGSQLVEDNQQHKPPCSDSEGYLLSQRPTVPFSIFDESSASISQNVSCPLGLPQKSVHRPLAVRKPSESTTSKESTPPEACNELNGIEPLIEDAILTGSYKNKTLCANPEDTCDFVRAAHLASTPFHGVGLQRIQTPTDPESLLKKECPESKNMCLSQQIPACEGTYSEALCIKKLSPIMEASQEDACSSGSSVSSRSSISSVTQISTIKYLHIPEKLELIQSLPVEMASDPRGITENATNDSTNLLWTTEKCKKLLNPLPELLTTSPDFYLETGPMPLMELEKEIELGNEIYSIKREYWTNEDDKMFFAVLANSAQLGAKGFAIKVYFQPAPWDFYITLQLQERLNTDFDQSFSENCSCFLYQDGCVVLHRKINCYTLSDVIQSCKTIGEEVIMLVAYNLLDLVEKLHKAEIVHGHLRPEVLFLGDRLCGLFGNSEITNALKIVDFSHSLDLRLQPKVSLLSFPMGQTQHGQQILAKCDLPCHVDLISIADIVHLMMFGEHLHVYQENSLWKINQNLSKSVESDFWSKFFGKILNADGKSTALTLRELREEMSGMFDASFQERLHYSFYHLGEFALPLV